MQHVFPTRALPICARDVIEGEVDAVLGAGPADAVVDRGGVVGAAELHGQVGLPLHAALRHRRVALEPPPTDGRLQARAFGEGLIQPALSDPAPRADGVGEDGDVALGLWLSPATSRAPPS